MTDLSDEIQEINLEGFQVVSGDLFTNYTRTSNPTVTLWHSSISFSKASLTLLNGCERIRVEINPNSKCLLIVPVTIKDKDNIHWVKGIKDPVPRKMECKRFTSHLYWNANALHLTYIKHGVLILNLYIGLSAEL